MRSHPPKILFVCTYNQWRSLTAEVIFKTNPDLLVRSAGISPSAKHVISGTDLEWADLVLCMENRHKETIMSKFHDLKLPPIKVLDISSGYRYMDPELVEILVEKIKEFLPKNSKNN